MISKENLKDKIPHMLITLGTLLVFFHSLESFKKYLFFDKLANFAMLVNDVFFQSFFVSFLTRYLFSLFV